MSIGKRMLMYSSRDPLASALNTATAEWGCLVTVCKNQDELRGKLEGGGFDLVVVEDSTALQQLVTDAEPGGDILNTPLSQIEKRHILRVLASTGGNKTRAAKILGIDAKTLYNKLKAYAKKQEATASGGASEAQAGG